MAWRWQGEALRRRVTALRLACASAFMVVYLVLDATVAGAPALAPIAAIPIAAYGLLLGLRGGLMMTVIHILLAQATSEPEAPRDFMDGVVGWVIATGLGAATGWATETMGRGRRQAAQLEASQASLLQTVAALTEAQAIAHIGSWQRDLVTQELTWSEEMWRILGMEPQRRFPSLAETEEMVHPE